MLSGSIMGQPDDDEIRLDWDPVSDFVRDVEVRSATRRRGGTGLMITH